MEVPIASNGPRISVGAKIAWDSWGIQESAFLMVLEEGNFSPAAGRTLPSPTTSRQPDSGLWLQNPGGGGQQTSPWLAGPLVNSSEHGFSREKELPQDPRMLSPS